MTKREVSKLFEDRKIRTIWDDKEEKWYFSIVDVVAVLTDSENPQTYWRVLKNRLKKEGNETVTNCNALKLRAADANPSFKVAAYRGWFETPKSSSSKSKAYSVGFGDDNTTDIDLIENENGEIDLIFDLGGKQLPQTKKGINIINNKKVIVK